MIVYKGFQSASAVVGLDKMQKLCRNISVCTDDGTLGEKGFVTQYFSKRHEEILAGAHFHLCLWSGGNDQVAGKNIK